MARPLPQLALALAAHLELLSPPAYGRVSAEARVAATAPVSQPGPVVLLTPAPGPETPAETSAITTRVVEAVSAHLGGSGIELDPRPGPPAHASFAAQLAAARAKLVETTPGEDGRARAIFWIDLRTPRVALIYLLDPRSGRIFERSVELDPSASEASIEALALIISASGQALTSGEELMMREVDRETLAAAEAETSASEPTGPNEQVTPEPPPTAAAAPTPSPSPEPPPPDRPQRRLTPTLSLAYLGESFSTSSPWQSGALVGLDLGLGPRAHLGLRYGFLAPTARDADALLALSVAQHDVSLTAGIGDRVIPWLTLAGALAATVGFARWRADDSGLRGTRVMSKLALEVVARFFPRAELGVAIELGVGAVAVLNNFDYVLCPAGQTTCSPDQAVTAESPWPVRPRAWLGVSYSF